MYNWRWTTPSISKPHKNKYT